ncbi:MAG: hypothetical protein K2K48_02915 [Anaeroplasmataceae bacterium]|nr:hypothetical protein [Anaeroplasmataceae bacterium]
MKRLWIVLGFVLLVCCSCKKNIEVTFEQIEETKVFAVKESTYKIEEVVIDYKLEDERDLFVLYTNYQNYLPLGYSSPANPDITLLSSTVKNNIVYYTVDNFILLSDLNAFHEVLERTGKLLGYQEVHIILNENQLI